MDRFHFITGRKIRFFLRRIRSPPFRIVFIIFHLAALLCRVLIFHIRVFRLLHSGGSHCGYRHRQCQNGCCNNC